MSDPKPVELLTESEKVPLLQAYTEGPIAMLDAVTHIVAAREAAARREALLEASGEVQRRMDAAESADGGKLQTWDALAGVMEWIEAALAEPERDEESGR